MGLTNALNTAVFGITYNQRQIDVAAGNIANADTAGYSAKSVSASVYFDNNGTVIGIHADEISRFVDEQIQTDYFNSLADTEYGRQIASYTERLDDIFGTLGDGNSLTSLVSELNAALTSLVNAPGNYSAQQDVVAMADAFARELNSTYAEIGDLRQQADASIANQAEAVNTLLKDIQSIDTAIKEAELHNYTTAELEDQRGRLVEQLSGFLDVEVTQGDNNSIVIRTDNGTELYANNKASLLSFDESHLLRPGTAGNGVFVTTPGGTTYDLIAASGSGSMAAAAELRDEVLVEAQRQLDTIAAEISLAFSNVTVTSTATTVGADSGYILDISSLQAGNTVTLEYTDSIGSPQTATIVAVEDATLLPLANSATANPDDTVFGIDISSGTPATYVANIVAALGSTGLLVSDDGSGNLQVLGNSATPTSVESLTADVTVTANSDQGLGLAVFVDKRNGTELFTDALESGGQRVGYSMGISVNPDLLADGTLLTTYQTTPSENSPNDPARAEYLLNALSIDTARFDPASGIGGTNNPFEGTVLDYINQTVAFQGNQAADAKTYFEGRDTLTQNLAIRYEESYSVDVDAELAFLVQLENAYAANARVMQTINELFDELLNIV